MSTANQRQVGGDHYKTGGEEHWDRVARLRLDYFQAQITKYIERAPKKNRKEDVKKAIHFAEKYLEVFDQLYPPTKQGQESPAEEPGRGYVNQDRCGMPLVKQVAPDRLKHVGECALPRGHRGECALAPSPAPVPRGCSDYKFQEGDPYQCGNCGLGPDFHD